MSTRVLVPPLGQTVDTVTIVAWLKDEGEAVAQGEPLFSIETDKATLDIEAPASGVLHQVTARPGDQVAVLSEIARIAAPAEIREEMPSAAPDPLPALRQNRIPAPGPATTPGRQRRREPRIFISPRARRLAAAHEVPWVALRPTGPEGAIVERDVRAYLEAAIEPDAVRQDHGDQVTIGADVDVTALTGVRDTLAQAGVEVSYDDLFLYILGKVLRSEWYPDSARGRHSIDARESVDVGLAVDAGRELLFPVIRDLGRKGLARIAADTRSLVEQARAGRCPVEELSGSVFAWIDLGKFGIDTSTQVAPVTGGAIFGVGRIRTQLDLDEGQMVARQMAWLSLTYDRQFMEGVPAARLLGRVVKLIEGPHLLFA